MKLIINAEDKNEWDYTSAPPHVFLAWNLVKHKDARFTKNICSGMTETGISAPI
jgi:hypothetical protein